MSQPVLIIGAGPVGLAAALELARFGVRSVLIEKHPGVSWHPKTRNFNTRTMEIARGWGRAVYARLRSLDASDDWKSPIRFLDTATGSQYGEITTDGFVGPGDELSPARPVMTSQELIEEILLDAVYATGLVDVRFECELLEMMRGGRDEDASVAISVRDGAGTHVLEGAALIAADGAYSTVRALLGIERVGPQDMAHVINCYFRAEIEPHLEDRPAVLYFVDSDSAVGVLQPLDARGRWLCQINVTEADASADDWRGERAADWVRSAAGLPDLDVEVLSVGEWKLNATVVERMVQGRVVLCGDAAHQFPPTGGLGVNTGLQGMHNVAWKLAWYVKGWADWDWVRTYETERRGVSEEITRQSLQNSINVARIRRAHRHGGESGLTPEEVLQASRRYGNHLGAEFGARYLSRAVLDDGSSAPQVQDEYSDYVPSGCPGARAPHLWLGHPAEKLSALDLVGSGWTLLCGSDAGNWQQQAFRLRRESRVPLDCYRIGAPTGLADAQARFPGLYGIDPAGAVLLRPDGHVSWRSVGAPAADGDLAAVLEALMPLSAVVDAR